MEKNKRKKVLFLIAVICIVLAAIIYVFSHLANFKFFGVLEEKQLMDIDYNTLEKDDLFVSGERYNYIDKSMRLVIPDLSLDTEVAGNTEKEALLENPGLYEYSQLPGTGDVNVSIAGHRDLGEQEFYYLDKLDQNSKIYLVYEGSVFEYNYKDKKITDNKDWSIIARQGNSTVTLTTCDPIGTSLNRLIVSGTLASVNEEIENYVFS